MNSIEINKIYNMDCLLGMDKMIADCIKVDAIITDIPYGTTACKWDSIIPFDEMWKRLKLLRKNDNTPILLFGSEPFSSALRMSNIKEYKYDWYWYKNIATGSLFAKSQPMRAIENICMFYKKPPTYNPQMVKRTEEELKRLSYKSSDYHSTEGIYGDITVKSRNRFDDEYKHPNNVLNIKCVFNRSKEKVAHPTQKPVELFEYLIKTHTNENDLVLDFTTGSGTTAIACINTKRQYIGFELDENYYNIANKRIDDCIKNLNPAS